MGCTRFYSAWHWFDKRAWSSTQSLERLPRCLRKWHTLESNCKKMQQIFKLHELKIN